MNEYPILETSVRQLGITTRAANVLESCGITSVNEIIHKTETELMRIPNLGRQSVNQIKSALKMLNLTLAMPGDNDWRKA